MSTYDRRDPGQDPDYCNQYSSPSVPLVYLATVEYRDGRRAVLRSSTPLARALTIISVVAAGGTVTDEREELAR